jgi:putative effector of murein hydrolase
MYKEIIVFLAQTLFNIFKVLEIKYTYQNKIGALLVNSVWINLVALASTYYAIGDLLNGNFTIIIFYIVGSVLGKYLGMQFGNPRNKIWKKLFNK